MLKFVNFEWLLKLIYYVAKLSGVVYISIDFSSKKLVIKKSFWNIAIFAISFGFSLVSCSFDYYLPVARITHSEILEIGFNFIIFFSIWTSCILKAADGFQSNRFFDILSKLQWGERNVNKRSLELFKYS